MMPRKVHGLKPDRPDSRDKHYRTDYLKIGKLRQKFRAFLAPPEVDLRNDPFPPTYDQGSLGSCVDNALAGDLGHVAAHHQGVPPLLFSRLFMYGNARGWSDSDDGSSLRDALKGVKRYGVPLEDSWPYDVTKFTARPPQPVWDEAATRRHIHYYRLDTVQGMKLCLSEGFPFIFGVALFDTFRPQGPDHVIPMPTARDTLEGYHCMLAGGYWSKGLRIRNSWGDGWGDKGWATLPWEYIQTTGPLVVQLSTPLWLDAWTVRVFDP